MLPGLHIKIRKSILSNIHTESFGQPHSIGDVDLLGDWSELDLGLSLHILEDQADEFVVLVDVDVNWVLLMMLVSRYVLDHLYLCLLVLIPVL